MAHAPTTNQHGVSASTDTATGGPPGALDLCAWPWACTEYMATLFQPSVDPRRTPFTVR